jgi:hypothetical protein
MNIEELFLPEVARFDGARSAFSCFSQSFSYRFIFTRPMTTEVCPTMAFAS